MDTDDEGPGDIDVIEREEDGRRPLEILTAYIESPNIAADLPAEMLSNIGDRVVREYDIDKGSRSAWEEDAREAFKLAMQESEKKNYPWPGAANVKYPLLTVAAIQFAARAYPAIVNGAEIVKAKVIGEDPAGVKRGRGERVARHMSWQLSEEMPEWESETDKLLHILPIVGMAYRKTYFDPLIGRCRSDMLSAEAVVVNDGARDMETVPRVTHVVEVYPLTVKERMRAGIYREIDLPPHGEDEDAPHVFLEQHRTLDLDDDGYPEPYIVTVHKDTKKVVRIVANFRKQDIAYNEAGEIARIERGVYFTPFRFLPNPTGGWHGIGFGYLLRPINEAVNSTINQLLDAGHLANVGGGFIGSGARLRGGALRRRIGQWVPVDVTGGTLRENLVPAPVTPPSAVLFQLLGLLIEAGKDISAVKDVMTGTEPKGNTPATTTLALIEQGMQVFSAIYKRIYRSLKGEFRLLYKLNGEYLDEEKYFTIQDAPEKVGRADYADEDHDIVPVADPNVVTNMQKLARAEFLMQFKDDPGFDGMAIRRRMLEAASIDNIEDILAQQMAPNPETLAKADEIDMRKREIAIEEAKALADIDLKRAQAIKAIADAEAAEAGTQIAAYSSVLDRLNAREKLILEGRRDAGRVSGMEGQPGDMAVSGVSA